MINTPKCEAIYGHYHVLFPTSHRVNLRHLWNAFRLIRLMIGTPKINPPRCEARLHVAVVVQCELMYTYGSGCKCLVTKINVVHYRFSDGQPKPRASMQPEPINFHRTQLRAGVLKNAYRCHSSNSPSIKALPVEASWLCVCLSAAKMPTINQ